jgi:hypothetical protein
MTTHNENEVFCACAKCGTDILFNERCYPLRDIGVLCGTCYEAQRPKVSLYIVHKPEHQRQRWYDGKSEQVEVDEANAKEAAWNAFMLPTVACVSGTIKGKTFNLMTDEHETSIEDVASSQAADSFYENYG